MLLKNRIATSALVLAAFASVTFAQAKAKACRRSFYTH